MERSSISIELKSISCKGVKSFNLFQKPTLYAIVSVENGGDRSEQKQRTPVDHSGGENPEWDHPMRIHVGIRDRDLLLLKFDVVANGILGDKVVGRSSIPFSDLDFTGALLHVSYQVRSPEGKPNGVLNFSYNIKNPEAMISPVVAPTPAADHYPLPPTPSAPTMGFYPPVSFPAPAPTPAPGFGYYSAPAPAPDFGNYSAPAPAPDFGNYSAPVPSLFCQAPPAGYFPRPDLGYGWSAQTPAVGGYYPPPPAVGGYYPTPPAPMQVAYAPQPAPAYCYPAPQHCQYGYQPECCNRGLYGYN